MSTLLVTFGCSWTFGVGAGYHVGTSHLPEEELRAMLWDSQLADAHSFRGLLSSKYGFVNKNFASGGSSNQRQFRLAKEFFSSINFNDLQNKFERIIVLWGITSTARNEMYISQLDKLQNFFYNSISTDPDAEWAKIMVKNFYDHDNEINQLLTEMIFWNDYFKSKNIINFWFDTFNHHNYKESIFEDQFKIDYHNVADTDWPDFDSYLLGTCNIDKAVQLEIDAVKNICLQSHLGPRLAYSKIRNLMFREKNPRDLLSLLTLKNGENNFDNNYHTSNWLVDSNRISYLVKQGVLNPVTFHPTQLGHVQIAELLSTYIEEIL